MPLMWNSWSARCIFCTAPGKVDDLQMTLTSCSRQSGEAQGCIGMVQSSSTQKGDGALRTRKLW